MDAYQAQVADVFLLALPTILQEQLHTLILFLVLAWRYALSNQMAVALVIILLSIVLIFVQSITILP